MALPRRGQFNVRLDPEVSRVLRMTADTRDVGLSDLVNEICVSWIGLATARIDGEDNVITLGDMRIVLNADDVRQVLEHYDARLLHFRAMKRLIAAVADSDHPLAAEAQLLVDPPETQAHLRRLPLPPTSVFMVVPIVVSML